MPKYIVLVNGHLDLCSVFVSAMHEQFVNALPGCKKISYTVLSPLEQITF